MYLSLGGAVDGGHVHHEVHHAVGVTPLVIVPGDQLHELRVEHDTGLGVEHGGDRAADEVLGHKSLVGVAKESLHVAVGASLDLGADVLVGGLLGELAGKVNHRHIGGRHTEGHTGDLALEVRDDLGKSLGGTGGGRNDVGRSTTATSPVLLGRTVNNHLGRGHGVHGGHKSLIDTESIVDALDNRSKTVGGAGSARHVGHVTRVGVLVHTHHNSGGIILGRGREDNLLNTSINVRLGGISGEENTSRLAKVLNTKILPWDVSGVAGVGGLHGVAVDDHVITVHLDRTRPATVDGIILELVSHVVGIGTSVDGKEIGVRVLDHDTSHKTSNTTETVDTEVVTTHRKGRLRSHTSGRGEGRSHSKEGKKNAKLEKHGWQR
mmetsp:Transcript_1452/g.2378  ORF Transcript_1452/g.2378 Transcript_1452/m.2378 type:complete len:379 (-) Transcript_1452:38-1174(-)